jgi:hypothetical protein
MTVNPLGRHHAAGFQEAHGGPNAGSAYKASQEGMGRKIGIPLRVESGDVLGSDPAVVAGTGGHRRRPLFRSIKSARPSAGRPVVRYRRCARREEAGAARGSGRGLGP